MGLKVTQKHYYNSVHIWNWKWRNTKWFICNCSYFWKEEKILVQILCGIISSPFLRSLPNLIFCNKIILFKWSINETSPVFPPITEFFFCSNVCTTYTYRSYTKYLAFAPPKILWWDITIITRYVWHKNIPKNENKLMSIGIIIQV